MWLPGGRVFDGAWAYVDGAWAYYNYVPYGHNLRPVRLLLYPNLYSAVLRIFFAPRFHINYFLLFSVMGVSPENFGFPPCEKDFFLYRNLFASAN